MVLGLMDTDERRVLDERVRNPEPESGLYESCEDYPRQPLGLCVRGGAAAVLLKRKDATKSRNFLNYCQG